jgi:hypothetical protein
MTTKASKPAKVPRFSTYEEEAEFWDAHSPEEFADDFEDVTVDFAGEMLRKRAEILGRTRLVEELAKFSEPDREAVALILLGLDDNEISKVIRWKPSDARRLRGLRKKLELLPVPTQ